MLSALVGLDGGDARTRRLHFSALLIAIGLLLLVAGARKLGSSLTPFPAPRAGEQLTTTGLYDTCGTPCTAAILIALGWTTFFASPVGIGLTMILVLFFELKAHREEPGSSTATPSTPTTDAEHLAN